MPHRLPLKELIDLVPPTRESAQFRYFEPWAGTAFDPARRTLSVSQAGWLMESALLAYSPPKQALRIFQRFRPTPTRIAFVQSAQRDVECYMLLIPASVIAVFRGSEVLRPDRWRSTRDAREDFASVLLDWTGNAKVPLVPVRPRSTRNVHLGFLASFESIWPALRPRLEAFGARRFWFTGHSLGGAMATLAADRFGRGTLVTFGSPRVGDTRFAATFRRPAHRIVNNSDIVAWVPPPWLGGYRHVGRTGLITAKGEFLRDTSWLTGLHDFAQGHLAQVRGLLRGRVDAIALESFYDHSPLLYVRQLRRLQEHARASDDR
jgi:hypothetical protein